MASHKAEMGQSLDVVDEGGPASQAAFGHSGCLTQRDRDAASNPVDDSARLACDEAVSGGHDAKPHTVESGLSAFGQCQIDALAYITMDDYEDLVRSNKAGRKRGTIENEMGCAGEQHPILHTGRLAFGSVCDDEWLAAVVQDCTELLSSRKCGTTVTD
jgi:hypothetical protein